MGFTKPIEQILFSYQGTFNVSKRYYTRKYHYDLCRYRAWLATAGFVDCVDRSDSLDSSPP